MIESFVSCKGLVHMRLDPAEARARFVGASVLRLATAGADGRPHLVPCTFAADGAGRVIIGIDSKPKTSANLRRLRNISENPRVSLLVDHYDDDWTRLWWVRADGTAAVERAGAEHAAHWAQLRGRYPQYAGQVLDGPVIVVTVESWTGWAFA
jgi:PPOX class probable F420-dependent enzyme